MTGPIVEHESAVLIIGAGPAGLVLGNLLLAAGVECVVVERRSRAYVEQRARAGFLASDTVRTLSRHGLADGLLAGGQTHDVCQFRTEQGEFTLKYGELGNREAHTVYPQQFLVRDLVAEYLRRGGELHFDTPVTGLGGLDGERPWLLAEAPDGTAHRFRGRYVAGCDGRQGVARTALPDGAVGRLRRGHGVSWLALLAEAPPSLGAVAYAVHERGFAGHMARTPSVTRYYLQCEPGTDPESWDEDRIWAELELRMRADRHGPLKRGPIVERAVVDLESDVLDPIQYGPLFLVGDAAALISPSAAKGANLAVMAAEVLARAFTADLRDGDPAPLARYSADCLPVIWRAQEFSHWMIGLLHAPPGDDEESRFLRALRTARLESLRTSRTHQDHFAENYVGLGPTPNHGESR
ncbi:4-hydroxybenzoate 3-monooxygenase [Kitasatospora terrestris]|uniref:4-hydroxybenzoate 3-monooxygenase n=1 Tax=Kitasatospora terrestris TaxID=258051 RepID=A0ABP9EF37_9ACTN